jgi:hypothetical protein
VELVAITASSYFVILNMFGIQESSHLTEWGCYFPASIHWLYVALTGRRLVESTSIFMELVAIQTIVCGELPLS